MRFPRFARLRIHLVGKNSARKAQLAQELRTGLSKVVGRTIVVPCLVDSTAKRLKSDANDHQFLYGLENDYKRNLTEAPTKGRHLVFADSMIDRAVRAAESGLNMSWYFHQAFQELRDEPGALFIYGPDFDKERTDLLVKYDLPVQLWDGESSSMVFASALLRVNKWPK